MNTEKIFWKVAAGLEQLLGEGSVWADWDVLTGTLKIQDKEFWVYPHHKKIVVRVGGYEVASPLFNEAMVIAQVIEFVLTEVSE